MKELTAKDIIKGITKGEWITSYDDFEGSHSVLLKPKKLIDHWGKTFICERVMQGKSSGEMDANAIVKAVNNTYLKSLDPEKMEECVKALELASKLLRRNSRPTKEESDQIMEAIESARIK